MNSDFHTRLLIITICFFFLPCAVSCLPSLLLGCCPPPLLGCPVSQSKGRQDPGKKAASGIPPGLNASVSFEESFLVSPSGAAFFPLLALERLWREHLGEESRSSAPLLMGMSWALLLWQIWRFVAGMWERNFSMDAPSVFRETMLYVWRATSGAGESGQRKKKGDPFAVTSMVYL